MSEPGKGNQGGNILLDSLKACLSRCCLLIALLLPAVAAAIDFKEVFETHGTIMLLIEPDSGRIVDANPAAASFYGYERDVLRTMSIQQINTLSREQVAAERGATISSSATRWPMVSCARSRCNRSRSPITVAGCCFR